MPAKTVYQNMFLLKNQAVTFGTLGWGGNCLDKAPSVSPGVTAHGHPEKHDADAVATDFRVEGRIRDKFLFQGSVDFESIDSDNCLEGSPCPCLTL